MYARHLVNGVGINAVENCASVKIHISWIGRPWLSSLQIAWNTVILDCLCRKQSVFYSLYDVRTSSRPVAVPAYCTSWGPLHRGQQLLYCNVSQHGQATSETEHAPVMTDDRITWLRILINYHTESASPLCPAGYCTGILCVDLLRKNRDLK